MDLPKGWISRQITRLEKEYLTWPDWMKRERNQKMDNFVGTWRTRDGSKVQVTKHETINLDSLNVYAELFLGKVLEPYISPELSETWTVEGNSNTSTRLDLMERISEKDPRR